MMGLEQSCHTHIVAYAMCELTASHESALAFTLHPEDAEG